jgi:hypothetical protein
MTMIARISTADSMPTPTAGPENSGVARSQSGKDCWKVRTNGTRTKMPHNP